MNSTTDLTTGINSSKFVQILIISHYHNIFALFSCWTHFNADTINHYC